MSRLYLLKNSSSLFFCIPQTIAAIIPKAKKSPVKNSKYEAAKTSII